MSNHNIDIVRKALSQIEDKGFMYSFYATDGSKCGCGGDNIDEPVVFTKGEVLYILSQELEMPEIFEGIEVSTFDLDKRIGEFALEYAGDSIDDDSLDFGGSSTELEGYVETWREAIPYILNGELPEDRIQDFVDAMNEYEEDYGVDIYDFLEESEE